MELEDTNKVQQEVRDQKHCDWLQELKTNHG